jgi:hypothetical protein
VILITACLVWMAGAAIMSVLYMQVNGQGGGSAWLHLRSSALMALLWGPVLALVWLLRAQGIERRKGLTMGRGSDEAAD